MFDGKFLVTLIALLVSVFALCNFDNKKKGQIENFGMNPSGTIKSSLVGKNAATGAFFSVPGTAQSLLSPRSGLSSGFGSTIRYNPPSQSHMAYQLNNPLSISNPNSPVNQMVEHYDNNQSQNIGPNGKQMMNNGCGNNPGLPNFMAAPVMKGNFSSGNFQNITDQIINSSGTSQITDQIHIGTMDSLGPDGQINPDAPIIYNRLMHANRNSRIRSQGDWIRGDLPIDPNCIPSGWFKPAVNPAIDLNQGAMLALGGFGNENAKAMAMLVSTSTGSSTIAGVQLSSQEMTSLTGGMSDINVLAFP